MKTIKQIVETALDTGKEVYVFRSSIEDGKYLESLIDIVKIRTKTPFTKIVCVSSGFSMGKINPKFTNHLLLQKIVLTDRRIQQQMGYFYAMNILMTSV